MTLRVEGWFELCGITLSFVSMQGSMSPPLHFSCVFRGASPPIPFPLPHLPLPVLLPLGWRELVFCSSQAVVQLSSAWDCGSSRNGEQAGFPSLCLVPGWLGTPAGEGRKRKPAPHCCYPGLSPASVESSWSGSGAPLPPRTAGTCIVVGEGGGNG